MISNDQINEKGSQKLEILQTYQIDIVEAETFEGITKHVFDAIDATIDPVIKIIGQVHSGAIRGFYQIKGEEISVVRGEADGILLDGPGIMVKAVNTKKTYNLPDTREDPNYLDPGENFSTLSEIAVPIFFQGKSIGVINIEETRVNAFDLSDQLVLETLSRYAGVSLSRILYSFKLNSLHKHTSQLSVLTSIEEVAKQTLEAMTDTLDFESCVFLLNQEGEFQTVYEKGLEESIRLREKAVKYFRIVGSEHSRGADDIEFISELDAPVNIDNEVVAILSAKSIQSEKYTVQDKQLLEILANHVASAIQRIRLLEERAQYEAKLEALHVHTSNLADAESIEKIAEYTINAMSNTLGYQWGLFMLLEDDQLVSLSMLGGYIERGYAAPNVPLDRLGITTRTAKTGKTQLVNDTRLDPDFFSSDNTLSELDVPIKIDDKVIGVLNVESRELNAFSEQDKELLEILASHVSSAIQRIRFQEEQSQYEAKLEARAKKLEVLNKDLEKEIQTRKEYEQEIIRVARESEVDRLRSQFLSTITHELRTPLTSIKGYLEVIRSGWVGEVSPEMNESLEVILRNADRLSTLTSDLLDIQRIASGRLEVDLKKIDLKQVIEQSVKEISPVLSEKKQILKLELSEESLEIIGDSQRLNQVLMNLLNNASKFSNEETTIHLRVKTDDAKILVSVKDSGIGILEADLERVFIPLAMIEKPIYVKGTGLGLSISKGLIDLHNGRIWAESEGEWKGSTFNIQLPKGG